MVKQTQVVDKHKTLLEQMLEDHQQELKTEIGLLLQHINSSVKAAEEVDVKGNVTKFVEQWVSCFKHIPVSTNNLLDIL